MDQNSAGAWLIIIAFVVGIVIFARMTPQSRRALCLGVCHYLDNGSHEHIHAWDTKAVK